jgi:hypothetical protein
MASAFEGAGSSAFDEAFGGFALAQAEILGADMPIA